MRSGPDSFLWGKGGEEKNTYTKRGKKKGKPARTTQRPRAGITNSNLKKTSRARRGARRRRRCPGAGRGRAGGSWGLPPPRGEGRGPELRPLPHLGLALRGTAGPKGGAFVASWQPGGLRVCVVGEGESEWCWGGDKRVFPRPGGTGGWSEFRKRLPSAEGRQWLGRGASAGCEVKESDGTATL